MHQPGIHVEQLTAQHRWIQGADFQVSYKMPNLEFNVFLNLTDRYFITNKNTKLTPSAILRWLSFSLILLKSIQVAEIIDGFKVCQFSKRVSLINLIKYLKLAKQVRSIRISNPTPVVELTLNSKLSPSLVAEPYNCGHSLAAEMLHTLTHCKQQFFLQCTYSLSKCWLYLAISTNCPNDYK